MTILVGVYIELTVKKWAIPLLFLINVPYFFTGKWPLLPSWAFDVSLKKRPKGFDAIKDAIDAHPTIDEACVALNKLSDISAKGIK